MHVTSYLFKCVLGRYSNWSKLLDICTFLTWWVGGAGWWAVSGSRCWGGVAAERRSRQNGGRQSMENLSMVLALLPTSWEQGIMWASGLRMWSKQGQEKPGWSALTCVQILPSTYLPGTALPNSSLFFWELFGQFLGPLKHHLDIVPAHLKLQRSRSIPVHYFAVSNFVAQHSVNYIEFWAMYREITHSVWNYTQCVPFTQFATFLTVCKIVHHV